MKYNLKLWVGCVIVLLAVFPFVYFHHRADDILQYFELRYNILDVLVACALTLPIFLFISFIRRSLVSAPRIQAEWPRRSRQLEDSVRHSGQRSFIKTTATRFTAALPPYVHDLE